MSLLANSIVNIPANLLIAAINIPYYESLALQEYAYALGPSFEEADHPKYGGVPGWVPLSATEDNGGLVVNPVDKEEYYARGGTGSWWRQSPTGNTWGWEDGNWPQMAAIAHAIAPFEVSLPIVQQLEVFAEAQYIAGANVNCEFNCADVLGYLGRWLMFSTPLPALLSGIDPETGEPLKYPDTVNASNPAYDPAKPISAANSPVLQPFWAGEPGAHLDPMLPLQAFATDMMEEPSLDEIQLPDPGDVLRNGALLGLAYLNDYNPLVTGSFLYWGAPTLYSVPALLAGLVQNFTGIPNQFIETPQWQGEIDPSAPGGVASGAPYPGHENAGPLSLLSLDHGLPAGIDHLVRGLLGYLDPSTYLGISLGNTLIRTYADGSLPGSDIARLLEGVGIPALLDGGVGFGDLVSSPSVTTRFAPPDVESLPDGSAQRLQLDIPEPDPTPVAESKGATTQKTHKDPGFFFTNKGISATGSNTGTGTGTGTGTDRPIKNALKEAGSRLEDAADDLHGGLTDAADNVKQALDGDNDKGTDNDTEAP